jgi:hypothetical protein
MPFGEKIYEGGNLHRMYISEILYALKSWRQKNTMIK